MEMEKNVNMSNRSSSSRRDSNLLQSLVGFFNTNNRGIDGSNNFDQSSSSIGIDENDKNITKDELSIQQYYNMSHENIWRSIPRKIRPVLKLCFACLSSTFTEFNNSKSNKQGSSKDNKNKNNNNVIYNRMMNIPVKAAYMLWLEILEIEGKTKHNDNNDNNDSSDITAARSSMTSSFNKYNHSNNSSSNNNANANNIFDESLLLSSFGERNTSSISQTIMAGNNNNDFSNFENQLSKESVIKEENKERSIWEYFITKEERDEFLRIIKNNYNYNGDVTSYIKDKLVSIGLLNVVETSTELPHNLKTLLMNSSNNNHNINNSQSGGTSAHAALIMNDDDRSIATNMNAYEDILCDDNSVWADHDDQSVASVSARTITSEDTEVKQRRNQSSLMLLAKKQKADLIAAHKLQHFQMCTDELCDYGYYFLLKRNRKDNSTWTIDNKKK